MTEPTHSLSIDIGGTFTDFTLLNIESGEFSCVESQNSLKQSESRRPPFR